MEGKAGWSQTLLFLTLKVMDHLLVQIFCGFSLLHVKYADTNSGCDLDREMTVYCLLTSVLQENNAAVTVSSDLEVYAG